MLPHKNQTLRVVLILGSVTALTPLSVDMYLSTFPAIAADLKTDMSHVELSLTLFFIGIATGQLFFGPLSDRFGRKLPLMGGLLLAALASFLCAVTPDIGSFIGFRFVQALGICAGTVIARAMVRDMFDHHEAARFFSLLMLVMGLAPILAPAAGSILSRFFGWPSVFYFIMAAALLCLVAVLVLLPETQAPNRSVRLTKVFHTYLDILRNPGFRHYALAGACAQAGMFAYITGSPYVLIDYFGVAPEHFGLIFGLNAVGLIGFSQLNRYLLKHHDFNRILRVAFSVILFAGLGLIAGTIFNFGLVGVALLLFAYVASLGMVMPNALAGALAEEGGRAGAASALAGSLQFSAAFVSSGLIGLIHATSPVPLMLVMGVCGTGAFVISRRRTVA
ncbi:Bcr/CflA family multidrug efflux MFS transporter [Kordiimonas marina]|uniref:Bcr/CflA family multidrug efflux MFS transporter n=1 Tax=Kordiimonas marina TaxID=2872312 RepID=UPI001FF1D5AE|nr:Bcr/CflA family multidrug efflux MFS transporter [Kordiimonas marina]MCJ9428082.1 Bcr/CflA family multidrug efflux MFS transporter [Kordiimonas marina]